MARSSAEVSAMPFCLAANCSYDSFGYLVAGTSAKSRAVPEDGQLPCQLPVVARSEAFAPEWSRSAAHAV